MKLGIMQPYLFPYIGYFQLINAADKFIAYDAVNFIKKGWINRNKILLNGSEYIFTVPLKNASSFSSIADTEINDTLYHEWKEKLLKTLKLTYANAPQYRQTEELLVSVFDAQYSAISELACSSIEATIKYLGINTKFVQTGPGNNPYIDVEHSLRADPLLLARDRVIGICKAENADHYINPTGGRELYSKSYFADQGIQLSFLKSRAITYPQFKQGFVPWLSIIDIMMFNTPLQIKGLLEQYDID